MQYTAMIFTRKPNQEKDNIRVWDWLIMSLNTFLESKAWWKTEGNIVYEWFHTWKIWEETIPHSERISRYAFNQEPPCTTKNEYVIEVRGDK